MNVARVAILEAFAPETQGRIRGLAGPRLSIGFAESDNLEDRARALDGAQYAVVRSVKMPAISPSRMTSTEPMCDSCMIWAASNAVLLCAIVATSFPFAARMFRTVDMRSASK